MTGRPSQRNHPPARTGAARRATLIAAAVILAGAGLVVALNIDTGAPGGRHAQEPQEVIELIPKPLTAEERDLGPSDLRARPPTPVLEAGGSIEIVDQETGRLSQRYRFVRLDPDPEGMPANWVRMDQPRTELYLSGNRVVSLEGDSALVHLPHRVLDSGTMNGNVTIKVFEPPPGRQLDESRDRPKLVVHTTTATFDNVIGEVRCRDKFRIETPAMEAAGRGLSVLINDQGKRVLPTMQVEHVEFLRLAQASLGRPDEPAPPTTSPTAPTAPETTPAGPDTEPPAQAAAAPPQHYLLTLHEGVRIQEGIGLRLATGDVLTALFSSETRGLAPGAPAAPDARPPRAAEPPSPVSEAPPPAGARLVALPQAAEPGGRLSLAPALRDDDVYITCTGPMTVVPVDDPQILAGLGSPQDAVVTLAGAPVKILDRPRDATVECDRLVYRGLDERIELTGTPAFPLVMRSPGLAAGGELFWISRGAGGFTGAGWLAAPKEPAPKWSDADAHVRMTWGSALDLLFDQAAGDAETALRRATFRGEVLAWDPTARVSGDELDVELAPGDGGRTVPSAVTVTGQARASDGQATMWSDRIHVTFAAPGAGAVAAPDEALPALPRLDDQAQVQSVSARGDVQVLLASGTRVFADDLSGDPNSESVELRGADVAIARGQMLLEKGRHITVSRLDGTARWEGPGSARLFRDQLVTTTEGRVGRDSFDGPVQAQARWRGSMSFDDSAAGPGGAGAIELTGGVEVDSQPDELQRTRFSARDITIELAAAPPAQGAGAAPDAGAPAELAGERSIGRIIARGEAKLDHRAWADAGHGGEPTLFYVAGDRIEYDQPTGEALVPGEGELLLRDVRPAASDHAFSSRGTTSFRWDTSLRMTRRQGTLYDIVMLDAIEMRHLALDRQISTLTCNRLDATVDRPDRGDAGAPGDAAATPGEAPGARLRRVLAQGQVFLRTPQRDVDCGLFDYDLDAGRAELTAPPGGTVTVLSRGQPQPLHMEHAQWDLATDTISIEAATGGGGN